MGNKKGRRKGRILAIPASQNNESNEPKEANPQPQVDNISDLINHLDMRDLINLNRKIVSRIKLLQNQKQSTSMLRFQIGDKVSFDNDGYIEVGTVIRLNKKSISLVTEDQSHWKVAPSLLNKVIDH